MPTHRCGKGAWGYLCYHSSPRILWLDPVAILELNRGIHWPVKEPTGKLLLGLSSPWDQPVAGYGVGDQEVMSTSVQKDHHSQEKSQRHNHGEHSGGGGCGGGGGAGARAEVIHFACSQGSSPPLCF